MLAETGLDDERHGDTGSGTETSGECDDEDGCEGSGEDEEGKGAFYFFLYECKYFLFVFVVANYNVVHYNLYRLPSSSKIYIL